MLNVQSQETLVERPLESKYRTLKHQLRSKEDLVNEGIGFEPSQKKTLVFCGIDGLFMFSTLASIVKNCDREIKIRKDGIKKKVSIVFSLSL
jgi:hypothetical protein